MTAILATGAVRRPSVTERALLGLSAWLHAAAVAHASRRAARIELRRLARVIAPDADAESRRAAVHFGLLPR
ncbi:hypothetical protein ACIQLJ_06740 [Microbacterium sp. NPDC091313]